jgi:thiol-disulfide isomerase/thioredoxin
MLVAGIAFGSLALVQSMTDIAAAASQPATDPTSCPASAPHAKLDFALRDLDGRSIALQRFAGKVLLLDFWATWCAPCRIEIPGLVTIAQRDRPRGVEVVGIVVQDDFANARAFSQKLGMTYPVLDGTGRDDLERAFGPFTALPTSVLVARDGRTCWKHIGLPPFPNGTTDIKAAVRAVFERELDQLLRLRSPLGAMP